MLPGQAVRADPPPAALTGGPARVGSTYAQRAPGTNRHRPPRPRCGHCGVGCRLTPHVQDNEIVKVTSPHHGPVTRGHLCIKGRFGHQYIQNRD